MYDFTFPFFCELLFFGTKLKTTYSLDDVTTMLSLTLLTSLWTLFMNVFVLVEWVCWISESGESVRTSCSRTRVFKSWLYDSAKGWDFTESPCFFFFFLHSHFNRNASNYRMFSFHLTSSTFPQLIKLLQPPTGQEVHTSSLKRNLKEDFCLFLNFFYCKSTIVKPLTW